ncbi:Phthalate dioxygenase reductase [Sulfitobacter sp. DSM 110093]|uniref:PDR/VanB family oxidoreductase n=1 Tax=Sulfitobacter sp. DSM 110093 TaxID=2883127 RepID=UPI001FACFBC3|nr:PDR/VanB family oxidoreductase [Sulfitobacter sp. DSM 110093]UOA33299.1 Phthalate dioxygenase reductase [Sulfitobacter sp. DSM 110093]
MHDVFDVSVAQVDRLSSDVNRIWLTFPDGSRCYQPGGHLKFHLPLQNGIASRSYSMVGVDENGRICIAVRRAEQSAGGSEYMHTLEQGDTVRLETAPNHLPVTYAGTDYALVAGGIGITPLIGIGRALLRASKTVRFVYLVREASNAPFINELRDTFGDALTLHDDSVSGLFDTAAFVKSLSADSFLYMCGPTPMMDAMKGAWKTDGRPSNQLRFETFGSSGRFPAVPFEVEVVETGDVVQVAANQGMLDALMAANQPVMFDCRKGECGLCKVNILSSESEVDHRDVFLSAQEKTANHAMCCCVSRAHGGRLIVSVDGITHGRSAPD